MKTTVVRKSVILAAAAMSMVVALTACQGEFQSTVTVAANSGEQYSECVLSNNSGVNGWAQASAYNAVTPAGAFTGIAWAEVSGSNGPTGRWIVYPNTAIWNNGSSGWQSIAGIFVGESWSTKVTKAPGSSATTVSLGARMVDNYKNLLPQTVPTMFSGTCTAV